jgi:ribosomal-protein-alanine N-acetyltransferase
MLDEATLLNIAVHPEWQRRSIAWQLLVEAIGNCRDRGASRLLLEVRENNDGAIALYRRAGFVIDGVRRDYYRTHAGREAALLMSLSLAENG